MRLGRRNSGPMKRNQHGEGNPPPSLSGALRGSMTQDAEQGAPAYRASLGGIAEPRTRAWATCPSFLLSSIHRGYCCGNLGRPELVRAPGTSSFLPFPPSAPRRAQCRAWPGAGHRTAPGGSLPWLAWPRIVSAWRPTGTLARTRDPEYLGMARARIGQPLLDVPSPDLSGYVKSHFPTSSHIPRHA